MASKKSTGSRVRVQKVKERFNRLEKATSRAFAQQAVEKSVIASIQKRFGPKGSDKRAQKSPDGKAWAGYASATSRIAKWRKQRADPRHMMSQTDDLRNSIKRLKGDLERGLAVNTGASVRVGVDRFARNRRGVSMETIARAHTSGATIKVFGRGRGVIPPRPFLGITNDDVKNIRKILDRAYKKEARKPGFGGRLFQALADRIMGRRR